MPLTRETPLTDLPGVGPQRAKKLEKLGLRTLGDTLDLRNDFPWNPLRMRIGLYS